MDEMDKPPRKDDPTARLFGAILMAVGAMIALLCGLCSLAVLSTGGGVGLFLFVALIGGIPIVVGVVIFKAGLKRYKKYAAN